MAALVCLPVDFLWYFDARVVPAVVSVISRRFENPVCCPRPGVEVTESSEPGREFTGKVKSFSTDSK